MSVKLYIRDNATGRIREYGTNRHDALILQPDGSLHYENMQNLTGTMFPDEGYTFVLRDGTDPRQSDEYKKYGMEPLVDLGGERRDDCSLCRWRDRYQKCTSCSSNPNPKSRFEVDKTVIRTMLNRLDAVKITEPKEIMRLQGDPPKEADITDKFDEDALELLAELKPGEEQTVVFWKDPEIDGRKTYLFRLAGHEYRLKVTSVTHKTMVVVVTFAKEEENQQ